MKYLRTDGDKISWYAIKDTRSRIFGLEDDPTPYDGEYGISNDFTKLYNKDGEVDTTKFPYDFFLSDELPHISYEVRCICKNINAKEFNQWRVETSPDGEIERFEDTENATSGTLLPYDLMYGTQVIEHMQYGQFEGMALTFDERDVLNNYLNAYINKTNFYRREYVRKHLADIYIKENE